MSKRAGSEAALSEFIRRTIPAGPAETNEPEGLEREAAIDRALRRSEELLLKMNEINSGQAGPEGMRLFMRLSDEYERLNLRIAGLRELA